MKKYALIGIGECASKTIDSFNCNDVDIDKIAIDDNEECLNSLQNSRTIKINIEKENENYKLNKEDKDKIFDLIKEYDMVCFLVCLWWHDAFKGADTIKELFKVHNDKQFIFIQTPLSFMGKKANSYAQVAIEYLKKITKNVFVINSKETLERTMSFTEYDWDMQRINGEIWRTHKLEFMKKFKSKYRKQEGK